MGDASVRNVSMNKLAVKSDTCTFNSDDQSYE